jgi:hypothetical protein
MNLLYESRTTTNSMERLPTLLNLSYSGLGNDGIYKLAKSCLSCETAPSPLVVLWLENNEIYPKGASALGQVISSSPNMKYLYMAHNSIGSSGVADLAPEAIRQLQIWNLAENEIGQMGARAIADCLKSPKSSVETLVLESNHFRNEGAKSLAESLKVNKTLKVLDVRYNGITVEGIRAFRDMLVQGNKTLQYLYFEEGRNKNTKSCCHRRLEIGYDRGHQARKPSGAMFVEEASQSTELCDCECCRLREEINYYLALNRAGRHTFGDFNLPSGLWPRIIERVSSGDPKILYAMLTSRPDILLVVLLRPACS